MNGRRLLAALFVLVAFGALGLALYAGDPATVIEAGARAGLGAASVDEAFEAGRQAGETLRLVAYLAGVVSILSALGAGVLLGRE